MFFDMLKYIYSESLFNTLYFQIKHKRLKNLLKQTLQKIPYFFALAPTHHSFTVNSGFLYELKYKVLLPKSACEIFYFWFRRTDSVALKHNSFQNKNYRKATPSFAPRLLIFKLQQEVWKFNDICVSWNSPKTDLETNF